MHRNSPHLCNYACDVAREKKINNVTIRDIMLIMSLHFLQSLDLFKSRLKIHLSCIQNVNLVSLAVFAELTLVSNTHKYTNHAMRSNSLYLCT